MNTIKKIAVIVTLSIFQQYAYATTYYIDSVLGNDSWSGKLHAMSSSSSDGPWQSLNRLATAPLLPGDVVELQCGSKWTQTLLLKNSGTPDLPITIRPTSSTCGTPPIIDGSQRIDAHSWIRHNDTVYKASWPVQKFLNGTLAGGVEGWSSWSASADQKLFYESSCPDSSSGCAGFKSTMSSGGSVAISNDFLMEGGVSYGGELSLRIPAGIKVKVLVRRGSTPYDAISGVQWITGSGAWQKISFAFLSRNSVSNARLDIEVPAGGVQLYFKNGSLKPAFAIPVGAWLGDLPLLPAYHPNRGHDVTRPGSVYASVVADSNAVPLTNGGTGSTYLDIDATLKLPEGVTPRPGNRLRIRSAGWHIDEATITQVVGKRLYFEPTTRYQIRMGQGFFLLGELGMLDSPGEWVYDPSTESTYAWTPDGNPPSDQIRLSTLEKGVDLSKQSNIVIEGINISNTGLGIDLTRAQNITLRSTHISNIIREGILATSAKNISIISNNIRQTGADAISAKDSTTVRVEGNDIKQSAVTVIGDRVWSLPVATYAAIYTGTFSSIVGNHIDVSAGNGIWPVGNGIIANGIVESNAILNSCFQMNDCGAIYINYASPNTRIASNLIERVNSNVDGVITNALSHAVGIYLDSNSTNIVVENNTVAWADYGILLHDSNSNRIIGNLLHGNRNSQLWLQEQTNKIVSTGDLQNNEISKNRFFPSTSSPSVTIDGARGSLTHFGVLSENYYSSLFSKRVVSESWPAHSLAYAFSEWRDVSSKRGTSQDTGSSELAQEGYATYLAAAANIVPNGRLSDGMRGWSSWSATAPRPTNVYETCTFGPCLRITAGGSETIASTPNFSVQSGHAYRVSFDARTGTNGQFIAPLVRRGGPLYERLMPASQGFAGSLEWRRYSFVFTAAKTVIAGDPTTSDLGARIDFENILPGQTFWIANMEIIPLQNVENTLRVQLVSNPDRLPQSLDCPDLETAPEYCDLYHIFPEGTTVSWPINLPSLGAVSIYTINQATRDIDGDGVADSVDSCSNTLKTEQVNAFGCAMTQIP